jgi:hypothetical protein
MLWGDQPARDARDYPFKYLIAFVPLFIITSATL